MTDVSASLSILGDEEAAELKPDVVILPPLPPHAAAVRTWGKQRVGVNIVIDYSHR